jgi:hypothetical protein
LGAVYGRGKGIVKVEPFIGGAWLAEKGVILEGFLGVGAEAVCRSQKLSELTKK